MTIIYKIKSLPLQTLETAAPQAAAILDSTQKKLGFVPNMYAAMANAPELLTAYTSLYSAFRTASTLSAVEQEVLFLTISRENGCTYCVAAHSFVADKMSGVPTEVTDAIRARQPLPDAKLNALSVLTATMVTSRGNPTEADVGAFTAAGYSERDILEIILAIGIKTFSNYSNHLFHTPLDAAFAGRVWQN